MFQGEYELEAELKDLMAVLTDLEPEAELFAPATAPSNRCPVDSPTVIRGFTKYDNNVALLPPDQQNKLAVIAAEIARSQSAAPGVTPVTAVIVVGHADPDPAMEARNPGFLQYVSEKRAHAVLELLNCRYIALTSNLRTSTLSGNDWIGVGRGARVLAIPAPRTEEERKCNRRAEIILVRSTRRPQLSQPPSAEFLAAGRRTNTYYHIALQGTSGLYEHPQVAIQKAREIAEKAVRFIDFKLRERRASCPAFPELQGFTSYFDDALQGTSSKYSDTDTVINRAAEIAEHAGYVFGQALNRLEWRFAVLPQPMGPDCEAVTGQVPGPANHALCRHHDHILDTTAGTVIAHDLNEYRRLFAR
jgi:outer membrane protein OmpA-like peptidoglycan-associated protein